MRNIGLLIAGLLWAGMVQAGPVKFSDAAQKASKVLGKNVVVTQQQANKAPARLQAITSPAFYVFNAEDGRGFVIISGDDKMPEVVAYSPSNYFDTTNMHPGLVDMLDFYTEVVDDVRQGLVTVSAPLMQSGIQTGVEPLCQTAWGQGDPYNNLCPTIGDEHCVTGCVATAMAQIMYYHQWPEKGTGSASYYYSPLEREISSNIGEHAYNWSAMKLTRQENRDSEEASKEVAQLCYDCGVAVHMGYGLGASSAYENHAVEAFYRHFGYRSSTIEQKSRASFDSQDEWNALLKSELDAKRPVLYSGEDGEGGHEFIIDGYDADGNFHVNWGWHGLANDGYYSILTLEPRGVSPAYTFSQNHHMVIGIMPDPTGKDHQCKVSMAEGPSVEVAQTDLGSYFQYMHGTFYNMALDTHKWAVDCALYSLEGKQLCLLTDETSQYTVKSLGGYRTGTWTNIPADTPNGYYTLRTVFRLIEKDADDKDLYNEHVLPITEGPSDMNQIYVQVANGVAYFNVEVNSDLELNLGEGWNWISHNVAMALDPFEVFGENVVEVKSQTQSIIRDAKYGMVGNLTTMDATAAYKVKTTAADTQPYQLSGYLFPARADAITLKTGWNWIGYPLSQTQTITNALKNFTPQAGDFIVGQDASTEFDGTEWSDPDFVLTPGQGYLYKSVSEEAQELLFNVEVTAEAKQRGIVAKAVSDSHWQCDKRRYPNVLPLTASLICGEETLDATRYDVGAFCGEECRGVGRVVKNKILMNVYGQGGETITFRVFDKETGETLSLQEQVSFVPDVLGSVKAPYLLTFDSEATDIKLVDSSQWTVDKGVIYNLAGQRMGTSTQSLPAGIYIRNGKKIQVK